MACDLHWQGAHPNHDLPKLATATRLTPFQHLPRLVPESVLEPI
jgi:hypothetical protein